MTALLSWKPKHRHQGGYGFGHDLDHFFDDFFTGFPDRSGTRRSFRPTLDLVESDQDIQVSAELPGVKEDDIDISVQDGTLTISGEKRAQEDQSEEGRRYFERSFGRFERRIRLGDGIDVDKIKAKFKDGILNVTLPKTPEEKSKVRRIPLK